MQKYLSSIRTRGTDSIFGNDNRYARPFLKLLVQNHKKGTFIALAVG